MEVGQFVQLCDVVPVGVCEPLATWVVHLLLTVKHLQNKNRIKNRFFIFFKLVLFLVGAVIRELCDRVENQ